MNSNRCFLKTFLATSLILFAFPGFAEEEGTRWLFLETEPEQTPIQLIGSLIFTADGNMVGTPVDPEVCSGDSGGDLTCDDLDVSVGASTFRGNNGTTSVTVEEGNSVSFTWSSRGAWECEGRSTDLVNWDGRTGLPPSSAQATTSQRTLSTAGLARVTPYTATLRCANGPVWVDESVSITVTEPDGETETPTGCDAPERQPPSGWTRLTTGNLTCVRTNTGNLVSSADCRDWLGIWPDGLLGTSGQTRRFALRNSNARDYIAIKFNTGDMSPTATGAFGLNTASGFESARKIMTVSKCPGDFSYDAIKAETNCLRATTIQSLFWGGEDAAPPCTLEANTDYYWNIVYTEAPLESGLTGQDIQAHSLCAESGITCGNVVNPTVSSN